MRIPALLALAFLPQDDLPADKHAWLRFKPGASATYGSKITYGAVTQEGTLTYALKEVGEDGRYTVSVKAAQLGRETIAEETLEAPARTGAETLRVGDRDIPCTIWTAKGRRGGRPMTARWWIAEGAPLPLRTHVVVEGEEDYEVAAASLDDPLTVDGRRYACLRLEGRSKAGGNESRVVCWASPEVPGGVVRLTGAGTIQGQPITSVLELSAFSSGK